MKTKYERKKKEKRNRAKELENLKTKYTERKNGKKKTEWDKNKKS